MPWNLHAAAESFMSVRLLKSQQSKLFENESSDDDRWFSHKGSNPGSGSSGAEVQIRDAAERLQGPQTTDKTAAGEASGERTGNQHGFT